MCFKSVIAINAHSIVDRWKKIFIMRPNDDLWKAQRKIFSQALSPADPKRFHSKQLSATHDLLRMLPRSDHIFKSLQMWVIVNPLLPTFSKFSSCKMGCDIHNRCYLWYPWRRSKGLCSYSICSIRSCSDCKCPWSFLCRSDNCLWVNLLCEFLFDCN